MNVTAVMETFAGVATLLKANGAAVIDNANYPSYEEMNGAAPQQYVGPAEYKKDMAEYFSELEVNPHNTGSVEDMMSCTKLEEKVKYPSCDIAYWEIVASADNFSSAKIIAAAKRMMYLGGPDGALDAATADALIFPSIVSSDVAGLVGYPVITVPPGLMSTDMPIKKNPRGDLIEEGPNVP